MYPILSVLVNLVRLLVVYKILPSYRPTSSREEAVSLYESLADSSPAPRAVHFGMEALGAATLHSSFAEQACIAAAWATLVPIEMREGTAFLCLLLLLAYLNVGWTMMVYPEREEDRHYRYYYTCFAFWVFVGASVILLGEYASQRYPSYGWAPFVGLSVLVGALAMEEGPVGWFDAHAALVGCIFASLAIAWRRRSVSVVLMEEEGDGEDGGSDVGQGPEEEEVREGVM